MANIVLRDLILVKKALALAVLVTEHQAGDPVLRADSDLADMRRLFEGMCSPTEREFYMRSARIVLT